MWIVLGILSAICLGFYDVSKKESLVGNSVSGVLLLSVLCSSLLLVPMLVLSRTGILPCSSVFYVAQVGLESHLYILLKAALVLSSWLFAYIAIKNLPLTIVAPVNATRPMWTLIGALLIFGEQLNSWQWIGVVIIIAAFYAFSVVGKKEGISFTNNKYIWALLLGMFLGAASGLYDKYLMRHIDHNAVQVYYTFYQTLMMLPVWLVIHYVIKDKYKDDVKNKHDSSPLRWRWWILGISVFLVLSDFFYLLSLTYPDSLIAVISTTRRCGVIIPFLFGALVLHDKNTVPKAVCLLFVLIGMICLIIGTV
ncbi:MAG: DMT family transporter [Paludibacteraceae bacterium]|nr:DMT family transporter [Paludibacteraceae bacterium]